MHEQGTGAIQAMHVHGVEEMSESTLGDGHVQGWDGFADVGHRQGLCDPRPSPRTPTRFLVPTHTCPFNSMHTLPLGLLDPLDSDDSTLDTVSSCIPASAAHALCAYAWRVVIVMHPHLSVLMTREKSSW